MMAPAMGSQICCFISQNLANHNRFGIPWMHQGDGGDRRLHEWAPAERLRGATAELT